MVEFDKIKEKGFFRSLIATWKRSLFYPDIFFKELNESEHDDEVNITKGILNPYFYAVIFSYINLVFSFFWDIFFFKIGFYRNYSILPKIPLFFTDHKTIYLFVIIGVIALLLIMGVLFTLFIAVITVIIHGFIMLMGGKKGIKNTFRIICYSSGVGVFSIFPIFGFNISSTWFAALLTMGIKETNKISTARAILTILLPFVFVSILLIVFLIKIISMR